MDLDLVALRASVAVMRELGVLQYNGITLGPEPTRAESLVRKMATAEPEAAPVLQEELQTELRRQRIADARQDVRDKLGRDLSDEEADRFLDVGAI